MDWLGLRFGAGLKESGDLEGTDKVLKVISGGAFSNPDSFDFLATFLLSCIHPIFDFVPVDGDEVFAFQHRANLLSNELLCCIPASERYLLGLDFGLLVDGDCCDEFWGFGESELGIVRISVEAGKERPILSWRIQPLLGTSLVAESILMDMTYGSAC